VAALDGELARSLREFDGKLLEEQKLLDQQRETAAEAAAAAVGGGGGGGSGGGASGVPVGEADAARSEAGAAVSSQKELDEETIAARTPSDLSDDSDDDVVARQLREAALREEDPELRERLWQEYRDYRKSGGSK
jgi:hypothetical protein